MMCFDSQPGLVRIVVGILMLALLPLMGCSETRDDFPLPSVAVVFNAPGARAGAEKDIMAERFLVERIKSANSTVHAAIYGFSNREVIDALIDAYLRGVDVKIAGDARHFLYQERGYAAIQRHHIPLQLGNQWHIMHNKFFIIDDQFVFVGTGNITSTGFDRNNNNWVYMDSPYIAADFKAEFDQMFSGKFSTAKERIDNGNTYQVGDTEIEVCFSPQEDCMGRILEELDRAETDVNFTIFAFTKDQVGSRFIRKHREFQEYNEANGFADLPPVNLDDRSQQQPRRVTGIFDRSQIHGNFLYHEVYRMVAMGIPSRLDANENSRVPGDYQAGGGRLHSKTMMIDVFSDVIEVEDLATTTGGPRVISGSFNWSSAATIANDEVMLILRGDRITQEYYGEFERMWGGGKETSQAMCNYMKDYPLTGLPLCAKDVDPGDILISEVHWDGWNGERDPSDRTGSRDDIVDDEFIELHNTTDVPINLSLWTITNGYDFKVGFTPGTVIMPGDYFLVLDHNIVPYSDTEPQRGETAFKNAHYVMNIPNDPRMPRMNLQNSNLRLELVDSTGRTIDVAGDYGPPFEGGRVNIGTPNERNYSMERIIVDGDGGDGAERSNWQRCQRDTGGENVSDDFKSFIIATPGEPNSRPE